MTELERQINNIKAVRRRIAQAQARVNPKTDSEFSAALNAVEKAEEVKDEWADRQIKYHKPFWFSVFSATKLTPKGQPTIRTIQRATCDVFGVKMNDILSARRSANVTLPRMVSVYLAKEMTSLSWIRIGRATGGRDHSTAINAHRKIEKLLRSDAQIAANVADIKARLA